MRRMRSCICSVGVPSKTTNAPKSPTEKRGIPMNSDVLAFRTTMILRETSFATLPHTMMGERTNSPSAQSANGNLANRDLRIRDKLGGNLSHSVDGFHERQEVQAHLDVSVLL